MNKRGFAKQCGAANCSTYQNCVSRFPWNKKPPRRIVDAARLGVQYTYTVKEACRILAVSRDVMDCLLRFYRVDALAIGTIYRIPRYSLKTIGRLIESGDLPLVGISNDSPAVPDLFGCLEEPQRETCILRSDLAALFEKILLCNKPVLDPEND